MHGVYLLWWVQEREVSPAAVAAILAAGDLALAALEVPTGWVADRYGHRVSLIAGSALQIAGMLCCWLARGVPGLLTASLLVALGDAFRSGADQALLYRSCRAIDREADFQRIEASTRAATLVALVALTIAGGVIVEGFGFAAGWIAETAVAILGLAIACAMVEPPAGAIDSDSPADDGSRPTAASRRESLRTFGQLAAVIAPASLLGAAAGATAFLAQTADWATPAGTTLLVAAITLAEAAGALLARRLTASPRLQIVLAGIGTVMLVVAVTPWLPPILPWLPPILPWLPPILPWLPPILPWLPPSGGSLHLSLFLLAVVALSALLGIAEPLRAALIQRLSADHVRARAASLTSACDKLLATIALIVAGTISRR